ncbi:60S ribosomal protein L7:L12 [Trichuris trichiura]|uniref:60S ribosomal protein L7:L12 n=1 Tax=Trichuris trichiura TaxID=36087 RepID=A0A077Z7R4_TRITR|nr:60S ribosomal protein L7:L12 [Trichuris trichiura]
MISRKNDFTAALRNQSLALGFIQQQDSMYCRFLRSFVASRSHSNVRTPFRLLCALQDAKSEQQPVFQENTAPFKVPPADGEPLEASEEVKNLVDRIVKLTLVDISALNKLLKQRLNLPDVPIMPIGPMTGAYGAPPSSAQKEQAATAKKTSFAVKLLKFDETKKIALIKEIKALVPGLNLVQAKKFVESLPQTVREDIGEPEAQKLKEQLAALGGECTIE